MIKGTKHTQETINKMKIAHKNDKPNKSSFKKGCKGTWFGKKFSEEHKENMSESRKGKHYSPNTEFKINQLKGSHNFNWNNGVYNHEGYINILYRSHPKAKKNGYIARSRLVVEKEINRFLEQEESVHHINENKKDDCPKNLLAFASESAHQRFHHNPHNVKPREIIFDGRYLI